MALLLVIGQTLILVAGLALFGQLVVARTPTSLRSGLLGEQGAARRGCLRTRCCPESNQTH